MWPIEVSKTLPPSTQLDGFDISGDQFPPAEWLPANVHLSTADAFAPVPEHMVGKYDVVHLRMMVIVVKGPKELEALMSNLVLLLSTCLPANGVLASDVGSSPKQNQAVTSSGRTVTPPLSPPFLAGLMSHILPRHGSSTKCWP